MKRAFLTVASLLLIVGCKPTYKQENFKQSVKDLAKKEYKLDVDVEQVGKTLGLRFKVKNLLSELYSGDDEIYKQMNGLFMVLSRVVLSSDVSPDFIVLDIADEDNSQFHLVFTRYVEDLRKSMAEALSYTDAQDRLLEEFVINGRRVPFDPQEMDMVRLMMMAMDSHTTSQQPEREFVLDEVHFKDFVSHVVENTMRRILRENKDVNKQAVVRQITASFENQEAPSSEFKILLDVVSKPAMAISPVLLEEKVLPMVAKEVGGLFKSYRFHGFNGITVIEKNSGKVLTVSGG